MPVHEASAGLFGTGCPGYTNCVSVFALTGRLLSLHRLSGVRELRQRVRPDGRLLSLHRLTGANTLARFVSPAESVQRKNAEETLCVSH